MRHLRTVGALVVVGLTLGLAGAGAATPPPAVFDDPAWSPEGQQIALTSNVSDENTFPDVYVMNSDGSALRRVTHGQSECGRSVPCGHGQPTWAPNGRRLAYQAFGFIDTIDLDGTHLDRVWRKSDWGSGACCPAWSPNGKKIVFVYGGDTLRTQLWLANADSTGKHRLALPTREGIAYSFPTWSPRGRWIAFAYVVEPHAPKYGEATGYIGVVPADGRGAIRKLKAGRLPEEPAWSHDGRRIAFADRLRWVAVLDLRTHRVRRLHEGTKPSWSPDDRRIAFEGRDGGIFVMDADGSQVTRLTPTNS